MIGSVLKDFTKVTKGVARAPKISKMESFEAAVND